MSKSQTSSEKETFLAKWLAGEISDGALRQYVSEADFEAFVKLREEIGIYELLESPIESTYAGILNRIEKKKRRGFTGLPLIARITIPLAASLLLLFGLLYFFRDTATEIRSGFGEQRSVELLDGSEVILNARSALYYYEQDWQGHRMVDLEGEAFFKVRKGGNFTVVTDNGSVQVLGTLFNIITEKGFFEVTCYEGKVKVVNGNREYILDANEAMRSADGIVTEFEFDMAIVAPGWISGESSFKSVPLKQVILALEKQFNVTFVTENIDDSVIFTGSFSNRDLDIALASVFKTVQLHYTVLNDKIILSK